MAARLITLLLLHIPLPLASFLGYFQHCKHFKRETVFFIYISTVYDAHFV